MDCEWCGVFIDTLVWDYDIYQPDLCSDCAHKYGKEKNKEPIVLYPYGSPKHEEQIRKLEANNLKHGGSTLTPIALIKGENK